MTYQPGSFSKNFAWHGTGLRKLYDAIRAGFQGILEPVDRKKWRQSSGIADPSLELIPINFFLHNKDGNISVDELVHQALKNPHTTNFDRLALFAFHLSQAGVGNNVVPRPAMWANEFVRERLWSQGTWHSAALAKDSIDAFLTDRLNAVPETLVKCRNNYRHLFELSAYLPSALPSINSGSDAWIASALFLTWDRHQLNGQSGMAADLIDLLITEEIYKLLGTTKDQMASVADSLLEIYLAAGGLARHTIPSKGLIPDSDDSEVYEWLDQEESDRVVERRAAQRLEQKRDRKTAAALKKLYNNRCMFCGERLQVSEDQFYSEAAHIKPIGMPHGGPDKSGNMLVLCPNHHLQFDRGILSLHEFKGELKLKSRVPGDPLNNLKVAVKHKVELDLVKWHRRWFGARGRKEIQEEK